MAVYKVIQDIEAEDKLLGPLTLKGLIYAAIAGLCAFINFRLLMIGTPLKWVFIFAFLMPMILFGVLASPLGRDQPTEVWLLSRIKFFLKPRKRLWDQLGNPELVTITAPKKIDHALTKDLTPNEVDSRLKALALTLDTRGWAIKNVNVNLNTTPAAVLGPEENSDRLISGMVFKPGADSVDIEPSDDMLDEASNPVAQKFTYMMQQADETRKHGLIDKIRGIIHAEEDPETQPPVGLLSGMGDQASAARAQKKGRGRSCASREDRKGEIKIRQRAHPSPSKTRNSQKGHQTQRRAPKTKIQHRDTSRSSC